MKALFSYLSVSQVSMIYCFVSTSTLFMLKRLNMVNWTVSKFSHKNKNNLKKNNNHDKKR